MFPNQANQLQDTTMKGQKPEDRQVLGHTARRKTKVLFRLLYLNEKQFLGKCNSPQPSYKPDYYLERREARSSSNILSAVSATSSPSGFTIKFKYFSVCFE